MTDVRWGFKKRIKCYLVFAAVCVLVNEWLVYILMPIIHWPQLDVPLDSVKLLLVGDPQLLGEQLTSLGIFGYLARYDSDRFISKTFQLAHGYVKPDIVIFLGDVLDEGEIATDKEYVRYFNRFKNVFHSVDFNKAIVIPGDNDIGGENEPPSLDNEKRFDRYFKNDLQIKYKFLEFIKVNYLTQTKSSLSVPKLSDNCFRVIISHIPLTPSYSEFTEKVFEYLHPHLILSAHQHSSARLTAVTKTGVQTYMETFLQSIVHTFNLTVSETHEIMVPTCSYRMGTDKMGYGTLIISKNGQAIYGVLWLPSRFLQLFIYLFLLVLSSLAFLPSHVWSCLDSIFFQRQILLPLSRGKRI